MNKVLLLPNFVLILILSINAQAANVALPSPSCTVTSLVPGPVLLTSSMEGSCYPSYACKNLKGVAIGSCGGGNSCCAFPKTCDAVTSQNHTYFTNPGYPGLYNGSTSCTLTVHKIKSLFKVCQIRLDFIDFELNRPTQGNCNSDRFIVSGQNSNSIVPPFCGRNTNQHIYIDVDGAQGPLTLRITTSGSGLRRWNIKITQIECANPSRAPPNCLQYYSGPSGQFSSFNYESSSTSNYTPEPSASMETTMIQTQQVDEEESGYLNGMDYTVCFRKEIGFCSQTYYVNTSQTPFEIINVDSNDVSTFDQTMAGAGVQKCPFDYLLLNGIRFCGSKLNLQGINQNVQIDQPIIDTNSGPFSARFVSDYRVNGRGFRLNYQQNPCGSHLPLGNVQPTFG